MSMRNFVLDSDILLQIKHLSKCLKQDFDLRLESYGLTGQQGRILFCINYFFDENKSLHQSDIEEIFHLSKSSVSEMVTRIESNGLIKRELDKPYFKLVPTEKGRSIVEQIKKGKNETIEKLFYGFKKREIENVKKYVTRMIKNIDMEGEWKCLRK